MSKASADDWQGVATAYEYAQKLDTHQNPSSPNFWIFNNWGAAIVSQAAALEASDLAGAQTLWKQAGEKCDQALKLKPDFHEAAYNWGIALDRQAAALTASDLAGAQVLWQQAGEKYGLALSFKPDKHAAAQNWVGSLIREYSAVKNHDSARANVCLAQAKSLLERHVDKAQGVCSYNLACVYALEGNAQAAIERLEQSKQFEKLPPAAHIRDDQDFNLIRQHPDFIAWWQNTFPNEAVTSD